MHPNKKNVSATSCAAGRKGREKQDGAYQELRQLLGARVGGDEELYARLRTEGLQDVGRRLERLDAEAVAGGDGGELLHEELHAVAGQRGAAEEQGGVSTGKGGRGRERAEVERQTHPWKVDARWSWSFCETTGGLSTNLR